MSDDYKYFKIEAKELIDLLYSNALALENITVDELESTGAELKRAAHSLKGAARLMELYDVGDSAHALENEFIALNKTSKKPSAEYVTTLINKIDQLKILLDGKFNVSQVPEIKRKQTEKKTISEDTEDDYQYVRVSDELLGKFNQEAAGIYEISQRLSRLQSTLPNLFKQFCNELPARISENHNLSELKKQISHLLTQSEENTMSLNYRSQVLQTLSLNTRLVAAKNYSHIFQKQVRSTALELNKEVILEIKGQNCHIDRRVMQELQEPLNHLLRNAIAHGIENPEIRTQTGKNRSGKISLSFEKKGENILIIVEDDGQGVNLSKLQDIAQSKDLSIGNEANLINMLFMPGFSSAETVSEIAGRGVGLDVVKNSIEKLRGSVELEFEKGKFCRFVLKLPYNLDIVDVLAVKVAEQDFLLPISSVKHTLSLEEKDLVQYAGSPAVLYKERPAKLILLESVLKIYSDRPISDRHKVILLQEHNSVCALEVSQIIGLQSVVIRNNNKIICSHPVVSGTAITEYGHPALLLNTKYIVGMAVGKHILNQKKQNHNKQTILVVDDSITIREHEKRLLESVGYNTLVADSPKKALQILANQSCDLALLDLEMPEMNGIELSHRIRENPAYGDLPIIMVTSRGGEDEIRKGLDAGLQAYMVKGTFSNAELLSKIENFI